MCLVGRGWLISSEAVAWHCLRYRELCILRAVIWLSIQASSFLFPFFIKHFRTQAGNIYLQHRQTTSGESPAVIISGQRCHGDEHLAPFLVGVEVQQWAYFNILYTISCLGLFQSLALSFLNLGPDGGLGAFPVNRDLSLVFFFLARAFSIVQYLRMASQ